MVSFHNYLLSLQPKMIKMAKTIVFFLLFFLSEAVCAQTGFPKYEVRGVWLTTIGGIDWPHVYARNPHSIEQQKKELIQILDKLQRAGINTVLLQTRVRATTIYPSVYEPWDGCLSGIPAVSPGYDALQFAISEAHRRGMELHAWVVTLPVGKWNSVGCRRLRQRFPKMVRRIGQEGYLNPERSETGDYLSQICAEITGNYDVDGIHLDYIRYPETWPLRVSRVDGRAYITGIVRKIHRAVKSLKPWVKLSCAPIGKADDLSRYSSNGWNAYTRVCQDAQGWLSEGIMDELFPMVYFRGNQFYPFVLDWKEQSNDRIISIGLGTYMLSPQESNWPAETLVRQMSFLREAHLGCTHFRSRFLTDNTKGIYDYVSRTLNAYPALVPPMTWYGYRPPSAPQNLRATETHSQSVLTWEQGSDLSDGDYLLYNIYISHSCPVDVSDVRNLVAARVQTTRVVVPPGFHYAVCAVDRYGNESLPATWPVSCSEDSDERAICLLPTDGTSVRLPADVLKQTDAEYVVAETLQGTIVCFWKTASELPVAHLPEGMFVIKALGHKGKAHRLGYLLLRRTSHLTPHTDEI